MIIEQIEKKYFKKNTRSSFFWWMFWNIVLIILIYFMLLWPWLSKIHIAWQIIISVFYWLGFPYGLAAYFFSPSFSRIVTKIKNMKINRRYLKRKNGKECVKIGKWENFINEVNPYEREKEYIKYMFYYNDFKNMFDTLDEIVLPPNLDLESIAMYFYRKAPPVKSSGPSLSHVSFMSVILTMVHSYAGDVFYNFPNFESEYAGISALIYVITVIYLAYAFNYFLDDRLMKTKRRFIHVYNILFNLSLYFFVDGDGKLCEKITTEEKDFEINFTNIIHCISKHETSNLDTNQIEFVAKNFEIFSSKLDNNLIIELLNLILEFEVINDYILKHVILKDPFKSFDEMNSTEYRCIQLIFKYICVSSKGRLYKMKWNDINVDIIRYFFHKHAVENINMRKKIITIRELIELSENFSIE